MDKIQVNVSSWIIVTGASGSMGSAAVRAFAAMGRPVIMACRNPEKGGKVMESIAADIPGARLRLMKLDLESLDSVREFAGSVNFPVAGLFNNAGTMFREYGLSPDGVERTMAVNFLGPYLLTRLLIPKMDAGAAVVNMVSLTCRRAVLLPNWEACGAGRFGQLRTYASSKLALLYFTLELARRYPFLRVNMADPGIVDSNMISLGRWFDPLADLLFRPFCKSPALGAAPAVSAMLSDESSRFFAGRGKVVDGFRTVPSRPVAGRFLRDPDECVRLWNKAARLCGIE